MGVLSHLSLANIQSLLKLLTFSHRPAKSASMMKMLLKLILNILLRPQKDSDLVLENLALRQQLAAMKRSIKRPQLRNQRPSLLDLAFPFLEQLAGAIDHRQTRNCHSVASKGFQAVLEVQVPTQRARAASDQP